MSEISNPFPDNAVATNSSGELSDPDAIEAENRMDNYREDFDRDHPPAPLILGNSGPYDEITLSAKVQVRRSRKALPPFC